MDVPFGVGWWVRWPDRLTLDFAVYLQSTYQVRVQLRGHTTPLRPPSLIPLCAAGVSSRPKVAAHHGHPIGHSPPGALTVKSRP